MKNFNRILIGIIGLTVIFSFLYIGFKIVTDPADDIAVVEAYFATDAGGERVVRGVIANMSNKTYSNVEILIRYLDSNESEIDSITLITEVLPPQRTFEFETEPVMDKVEKFKVEVSSPDNSNTND